VTTARWSFEATLRAPQEGRRAVREFAAGAGATARALGAIAVCVSEAMTNVVVHAYWHEDRPGRVEIQAELMAMRYRYGSAIGVAAWRPGSTARDLDWGCP
jgi:anti-sigma regulatory factor (Ser/Thr protein kinase)